VLDLESLCDVLRLERLVNEQLSLNNKKQRPTAAWLP